MTDIIPKTINQLPVEIIQNIPNLDIEGEDQYYILAFYFINLANYFQSLGDEYKDPFDMVNEILQDIKNIIGAIISERESPMSLPEISTKIETKMFDLGIIRDINFKSHYLQYAQENNRPDIIAVVNYMESQNTV